ncbi:MAG TPA: Si-specific NAD(P)(+) transhydrogenase [Candidatus Hydrogenedentes bacterium]|nr:Si-specific NAD(P)(+) transhydrogenase [Candidatus Hydrogenedentota bacterium]
MQKVDLLVIGSGPAGQRAAIQGVKLGKRVVVVEKRSVVGGVCTNFGTIPSKTLREAILHLSGYRHRNVYGRSYGAKRRVTFGELRTHINIVIQHEVEVARDRMMRTGVEIIPGTACFETPNIIRVSHEDSITSIEAEKVIIAAGTIPYRAERVPFNGRNIIDTDRLFESDFDLQTLPKSMLVVGAGVIGTEYACMFATIGVDTRLLDRRTELFRFVDPEICEALTYHMRSERITLYLGKDFKEMREDSQGKVVTTLSNGREIKTDMMLFASGRSGAIADLNLDAAGVKTTSRGLIEVNENLQTNVAHIYAAGDIIGFPALASTSMEQGRQAACRAFGVPFKVEEQLLPYGIYTIPEISMVGKTERELMDEEVPYEIGIARYREVSKGKIMGDEHGMLKLVFHQKTGRLLGVHIIGDGASELVHIGQAVMGYGGSISYFVDTVFNYPTLAEAYKIAALNGLKRVGATALSEGEFEGPKTLSAEEVWVDEGTPPDTPNAS